MIHVGYYNTSIAIEIFKFYKGICSGKYIQVKVVGDSTINNIMSKDREFMQ